MYILSLLLILPALVASTLAASFNPSCNSNYASYYGQNSAGNQQTLGNYCKDTTEDIIILAFMHGFPNVMLNFANACESTFPGSSLLHCPQIAEDIKYCQSKGKIVILSMGGASGSYGFSSDAQAKDFADTVWGMFFKGTADKRPFDDAVLDGVDLDIEGGSTIGYTAFINQLRSHYATDPSRQYYIAAAPQCPFPDAYLGSTLNSAWFDMVFVQFYNNYCGLTSSNPDWFNFEAWDRWAKHESKNYKVKIYLGAPGSPSAASTGFIDGSNLSEIFRDVRAKYSSLGGIMTWDVSQSRTSGIAGSVRKILDSGRSCSTNNNAAESGSEQPAEPASEPASESEPYSDPHTDTDIGTDTDTDTDTDFDLDSESISSDKHNNDTTTPSISPDTPLPTLLSNPPSNIDTTILDPKCPIEGSPCMESTQGCNQSGYALCISNKWAVYRCSSGTSCTLQNNIALCDWSTRHQTTTCTTKSITHLPITTKYFTPLAQQYRKMVHGASVYTSRWGVNSRIAFDTLEVKNGRFMALVKVQTLLDSFSHNWKLRFQLPFGQFVDHVDRGSLSTSGGDVVIVSDGSTGPARNMAVSIKITGRYYGPYRMPNLANSMLTTS